VDGAIANIQNVNGGAGDDVLVGNTLANLLNGNKGRDLLIGGLGADILNGGDGEDILIGGTTVFDSDASGNAFTAIMKEWTSTQTYANRRLHLLGLPSGVNGAYKLTNATVQPDMDTDQLTGGNDADWFWGTANEIVDLDAGLAEKIGVN
jgi:Ca2+-binding RTX toxin-like protein